MKYWLGNIKGDIYSNPITGETYEIAYEKMLKIGSNQNENLGTLREVTQEEYQEEIDYIWKKRKGEI
jgi:hypothetical protein